jgi:LysR family transcriptional regulator, hydrogen peroxide-inducible genes activator
MNRWPSLKQLHYLVALAECQNFNRAAKQCFVSQSTLSTGIQTLEELFGVQLIERDHKSFIMTVVGMEVVERARRILSQTQDMMDLATLQGGVMSGTLRLGCIPTIAPFLLSELVNRSSLNYPDLQLLLREDTSANLLLQLEAGELDLLVLALPYELRGLHSRIVGHDPFKLVVHRNLAQTLSMPLDYRLLPEDSIFLLEQEHCLTGHALAACHLADRSKINPFAATSLYTLIQMVSARAGATFLPQMAINSGLLEQTELVALSPTVEGASREIGLVWRPSTTRVETFYAFGDLVTECITACCR